MSRHHRLPVWTSTILTLAALATAPVAAQDADRDGLPDAVDSCPAVTYEPGFDWHACDPMDLDPTNDLLPQCRARERIANALLNSGVFATHIAFAVVKDGAVHFADAFAYLGGGQWEHDPEGVHRLYRIGSTSKAITATAAKVLQEAGELSIAEHVSDDDASQVLVGGQVTLRQLLSHQGAFSRDSGALHLFCYPGDLVAFWSEPDDLVSPHYDSDPWGNLGGAFDYSAFNFSLAGAYLAHRTGETFADILQSRVFDTMGMCTAMVDGERGNGTPIGADAGTSQTTLMHVGPYINQVSLTDRRCEDNFYSSDDLPDDPYTWQAFHLDEADGAARDPAGGIIASVIDMARFAADLLASYHGTGGVLSPDGVRDLWEAEARVDGHPCCPMQDFYGLGFLTSTLPGEPVLEVEHGGARAGFRSGLVIRPETNLAVSVLVNGGVGSVVSDLGKMILDDFATVTSVTTSTGVAGQGPRVIGVEPNPRAGGGDTVVRISLPRDDRVLLQIFDVAGRLVGTVASGDYAAGDHALRWRAAEQRLAAGVYLVRLTTAGAVSSGKFLVLE